MRKSGQITVFLALAMMCICSLVCGLIESARTAGAGWYFKQAADSAMDSVFSGYHKEAWEKYRIFLLEYGVKEELADTWLHHMEPYAKEHGWYPVKLQSASIQGLTNITGGHGFPMKQEIQDYMRYGIAVGEIDKGAVSKLWDTLQEAESAETVSVAYNGLAIEAVDLERALEKLWESLERQEEYGNKAKNRLSHLDGAGFRAEAERLKAELKKIPGLVKDYGKKADQLAVHLEESRKILTEEQGRLSEDVRQAMAGELEEYEAYCLESGEKRLEIEALPLEGEANLEIINRAIERTREVEEELERWEDEKGEKEEALDGPDEEALWGSVEAIWTGIRIPVISFRAAIKDPEKQRLLEQVQNMAALNLLTLILPEGTELSKGVIPTGKLPSAAHDGDKILKDDLIERLLTDEYVSKFFTCFLSEEEKEVEYEREYALGGKNTDEENLKAAAGKILAVREGLNLIHILSDGEKREAARALAGVITGIVGAAPLLGVVAFFIMTVWALGESILDVKALLAGNRVPLIKSKDTWKLDLAGLLSLGEKGKAEDSQDGGKGTDYEGYLKLLLFVEPAERLYYRIMDVIQMNIARTQKGFSMEHCAYRAEIKGTGTGKHLFLSGGDPHYGMEVHTDKAY